jgi:hypothetical protein
MLGGHATAAQQKAYRSCFSIERLVDEATIVCAIGLTAVVALAGAPVWTYLLTWLGSGAVFYLFGARIIVSAMPAHLRQVLPTGRYDGPTAPATPRSYRELLRLWLGGLPAAQDGAERR